MISPLVSVIIPIYKTEKYLEKCVRSVMNQTYTNLEILLIDDGSPDNCAEICDKLASEDHRITVVHKKNGGLSDARNSGLLISQGEYIFFLDSDDYISLDSIYKLITTSLSTDSDIVCADYYSVDESGKIINNGMGYDNVELSSEKAIDYFLMKNWGAWGKLYKSKIHKSIQFPFGRIHEDEAIMLQLLSKCEKIVLIQDKLYFYLQRTDSITSLAYSKKKMDWFYAWNNNINWLKCNQKNCLNKGISKAWDVALYNISNLIEHEENCNEMTVLYNFALKYKFRILSNRFICITKKLRLIILLFSNIKNNNCFYCRFYRLLGRI